MKYYFDKYKKKYLLNDEQINKIKDNCKMQGFIAKIEKQKVNLESDDTITKYYKYRNQRSKL